jgi:DNA helicase-2/ATP-dependent DNA helicase PcrA
MVDEYQDTNRSQYELMRLLTGTHGNICVVGDEDQSIYSWRGADIRNILDFERDFPQARTIRLEQNYRSTKNILAAAGAVVENNKARKGKTLWTEGEEDCLLGSFAAQDAEAEAVFIADQIDKYLASNPEEHIAVLYRTNFQSRQIEEALRRRGQKYNIVGGFSFYQRAEIKDLVAYLKLTASSADSASLLRIINTPARGIGRTTVEQIEKHARARGISLWDAIGSIVDDRSLSTRSQSALVVFRNLIQELSLVASSSPVPDLIRFILNHSGYRQMLEQDKSPDAETRLENLEELINAAVEAEERGETLFEFLDNAALVSEADTFDPNAPVTLMTMHNAKGLEFPMVVLAGMEMGLFPHSRSIDSPEALEEERRLCYVGMTRAQKRLVLTYAKYRRRFGGGDQERSTPSPFLGEVPVHLIENLGQVDRPGEMDLYSERYNVRHAARGNTFTGKTYDSIENISQFFSERGTPSQKQPPTPLPRPVYGSAAKPQTTATPPTGTPVRRVARTGSIVEHPKYGTGTVVRREGEGENAKITVNFPRFGLKKLVEKYAGLKRNG